jgi:hypothetical protein
LANKLDLSKIKTEMVPGKPEYINNASYWIADEDALDIMVDNLIRSKEYIENDKYYITILNGNGVSGVATKTADELKKYGFNINDISNADRYDYEDTIIYYKEDEKVANGIQEILGGEVESSEEIEADFKIILGEKFLDNSLVKKEEHN